MITGIIRTKGDNSNKKIEENMIETMKTIETTGTTSTASTRIDPGDTKAVRVT
ncbi:MAG: hypothetical protein KJ804_02395 [Proteobacteria bacterium]|nr:hypothetical protein [Pseudomonadota bacterium]MBU1057154.1 hypothetical protein [Pseudomonadota bacterium]